MIRTGEEYKQGIRDGREVWIDGERVKDDGILEPFDVSLEEAQHMVMTARVLLGWVDPAELEAEEASEEVETQADA